MSRVRLTLIALGMAFVLPALTGAEGLPVSVPALSGTWQSAVDEVPLSTAFDESVWGKNAKSVRSVQMSITPAGDATLTVTRRVVDGRGRTVAGSTSIEHAELSLGPAAPATGVRSDLAVTVKKAERRYPDDPAATWALEGLRVGVTTFTDDPGMIEVRVDVPEGRGSFWDTLRRTAARKPSTKP